MPELRRATFLTEVWSKTEHRDSTSGKLAALLMKEESASITGQDLRVVKLVSSRRTPVLVRELETSQHFRLLVQWTMPDISLVFRVSVLQSVKERCGGGISEASKIRVCLLVYLM